VTREAYLKHKDLIEAWANGAEIKYLGKEINEDNEIWIDCVNPKWNEDKEYRIKPVEPEFTYPMWFKWSSSELVVRFDALREGQCIVCDERRLKGEVSNDWVPHTKVEYWTQIPEPKPKKTIIFEEWLTCWYGDMNLLFIDLLQEGGIDRLEKQSGHRRVKLLSTKEVEIDE
jgi:hypothetical protein